jgi:N-acetylmuramoyl-L-alanine amidase
MAAVSSIDQIWHCQEQVISTTISGQATARMINQRRLLLNNRLQKTLNRKSTRKRLVRYGLIAANVAILVAVVSVVAISSHTDHSIAASVANGSTASSSPVDGLTSYDIAANVAHMTSLPETTAINNQAQSAKVALAVSASDTDVAPKPQLVTTALKSRKDIQVYTAVAGDTVTSISQKFGITTDSIKWSNNLSSDSVSLGAKLTIPPVNGIVYTVQSGDTVQSLATKYKANVDQIIAYNDAEISGIQPGEQVLIPNGQVQTAAATTRSSGILSSSSSFIAQYGSNGYDFGYCTYYAAARSGAPSNWGNANTWAYYAALSGWTVSSTPQPGAIAQTSRGYDGHVAIVEAVSADGTQIKYSDMNGLAGWGRVGYSDWVSSGTFEHYIYR